MGCDLADRDVKCEFSCTLVKLQRPGETERKLGRTSRWRGVTSGVRNTCAEDEKQPWVNGPYAKCSAILDYRVCHMHLESSFASFATTPSRSTCRCTSIQIQAKFVAWSVRAWTFSLFVSLSLCVDLQARCSEGGSVGHFWFNYYELWGCVIVLRPRRKERPKGPPPHAVWRATTASSRACHGWGFPRLVSFTAEPSSLGTPPTLDVTVCMWRSTGNRWLN